MLITQLGKTRLRLLASVQSLSDEQLDWQPDPQQPSPARIIVHVAAVESAIAGDILGALGSCGEPVADQNPAALGALIEALSTLEAEPAADTRMLRLEADGLPCGPARTAPGSMTKQALVRLLEESRFRHLQRVFNETHERVLAEKSLQHPRFGRVSLKNLADLIWLHDAHQIDHITRIQAAWDRAGDTGPATA